MREKKEVIDKINKKNKDYIADANVDSKEYVKKYGIIGLIVIVLLACGIYYGISKKDNNTYNKFKEEYESLNGTQNSNGKENMTINIRDDVKIVYSNYEEIFQLLDSGTGVIYFGFPECPWCRALVPNLLDAAKEAGIDKIYYFNNREDRNTLELKDKKIVTVKEGTDNYNKLVEKLYDYLGEYEGLNDKTIKRLYFPTVVFLKDGAVVDIHIGTFDEQEDPRIPMTDEEKTNLKETLIKKFNKTIVCDSAC